MAHALTMLHSNGGRDVVGKVAQSLAHARHLVLPQRGHNDTDPCVNGMIEAFMIAGSLAGLDTNCLAKTEDLSFALQRDELEK